MNWKKSLTTAAVMAVLPALAATTAVFAQESGGISVAVNGNTINFPVTQPVEIDGSVLVPLRGVFQALGAHVNYDQNNQTITAWGSGRQIVLQVGASTATVNGQPEQLSQPAQAVNGYTLVPLRFVAEALGDYVGWDSANQLVSIQSSGYGSPSVPSPPPSYGGGYSPPNPGYNQPDNNDVSGVASKVVIVNNIQYVEINVNGAPKRIPVTSQTKVVRGREGQAGHAARPSDIKPGDQIKVHIDANGHADSITAVIK